MNKISLLLILGLTSILAFGQDETSIQFKSTTREAVGKYKEERLLESLVGNGSYLKERQIVQDQVIDKLITNTFKPTTTPRIIFTAGGMGTGKNHSLLSLEQAGYFNSSEFIVIDPDDIKKSIPEFMEYKKLNPKNAATLVHRESTFIADLTLDRALAEGKNIIVQGSLRDVKYFEKLYEQIRKTHGQYQLEIVHVKSDKELARNRAILRADLEGRHVPDELINASLVESEKSVEVLSKKADNVVVINNDKIPTIVSSQTGQIKKTVSIPLDGKAIFKNTPLLSQEDNFKHVVFDLDWTLINKAPDEAISPNQIIKILDEKFYVSTNSQDVITALANDSRVKISFFSGGDASRNLEALKKIKLNDGSGRSFYDIAYKVLSKPHLHDMGLPETAKFAERFKKNLKLITSNLDNVILVDDIAGFSLQKGNDLYLGRTYKIFENYAEAEKAFLLDPKDFYIPSSKPAWVTDRYKIPAVYGIIDEALTKSEKGESFSKIVNKLSAEPREKYVYIGLQKIKMKDLAQKLMKESLQRRESIKRMRLLFKLPSC